MKGPVFAPAFFMRVSAAPWTGEPLAGAVSDRAGSGSSTRFAGERGRRRANDDPGGDRRARWHRKTLGEFPPRLRVRCPLEQFAQGQGEVRQSQNEIDAGVKHQCLYPDSIVG